MENKTDISHYTFHVGRYLPTSFDDSKTFKEYKPNTKELVWNTLITRNNKVEVYNIFNHGLFMQDLYKIKTKHKNDDFKVFADNVRQSLSYYFWSKCEWEVIVTSWPPYVDEKEIDRLAKEKTDRIEKYGNFYRESVSLADPVEKIDVYDQIMINWDCFINYLWSNINLIKKPK